MTGGASRRSGGVRDWEERLAAVLTERDAVVWAGAGTGKTHTLTLRALYLLFRLGGDALGSPEEDKRSEAARRALASLVLVTFTRKAAAEMQDRIFAYLHRLAGTPDWVAMRDALLEAGDRIFAGLLESLGGSGGGKDSRALATAARVLLEHLTELHVSTIHSFALDLLRRYPLQTGLPGDLLLSEDQAQTGTDFEELVFRHWWRTRIEGEPETAESVRRLLQVLSPAGLGASCRELGRRPWMLPAFLEGILEPPDALEGEELVGCIAALADALGRVRSDRSRAWAGELAGALHRRPQDWWRVARLLSTNRRDLFERRTKGLTRALEEIGEPVRSLLEQPDRLVATAVRLALEGTEPGLVARWRELLGRYAAWRFGNAAAELRTLSFDEIIRLAVALLERHPAVRRREQERLRFLLVDEFQDTDPDQLRLLELLAQAEVEDRRPRLFLVGDVKQSIYRFRRADTMAVRRFCREVAGKLAAGLAEFRLSTSFRSRRNLLEFVNACFRAAVPLTTPEEELEAFRENDSGEAAVEVLLALPPGGDKLRAADKQWLAARAAAYAVRRQLEAGRSWEDILVVTRTQAELDKILLEFAAAGIPVAAAGARSFQVQQEVLDVLNLLIALLHPGDTLAHAAVLASPLVGLGKAAVAEIQAREGLAAFLRREAPSPAELGEEALNRLRALRRLTDVRRRADWGEWLAEVRRLVPSSLYGRDGVADEASALRIERVFQEFAAVLARPESPVDWLLEQRNLVAQPEWRRELSQDVSLVEGSVKAVRAMTIHQAKGLESPVVIVSDWPSLVAAAQGGAKRGNPPGMLELTDDSGAVLREFRFAWDGVLFQTPGYGAALQLDELRDIEEAKRVAYVAATRAREKLVLVHPVAEREEAPAALAWLEPLVAELTANSPEVSLNATDGVTAGWLETFRERLEAVGSRWIQFEAMPDELGERREEAAAGDSVTPPPGYQELWRKRLERCRAEQGAFLLHRPSREELYVEEDPAEAEGSVSGAAPRELALTTGRLVHAYLERALDAGAFDAASWRACLRAEEVGEQDRAAVIARAVVERFLAGEYRDGRGRPLISRVREAVILGRELPVYLVRGGEAWHGVLDLALREGDAVVGVDFKVSAPENPLPPRYACQEAVYTEALRRLYPDRPVSFEFWWLDPGEAFEVPPLAGEDPGG
ncbi:MAG: hypothetical protein Kow00109_03940 [Acidobacteriota bacterium]